MDPRQCKEERMCVDGQWYISKEGEEKGFLGDSFDVSLGVGWAETWNVWQGAGLEIE